MSVPMVPPTPRRILISDLCDVAETYLEPAQVQRLFAAYLFGAEAHQGQKRRSGEAFIFHPVAVAYILAQMRMDGPTLCAAILHDVLEDTPLSPNELTQHFGEEVTHLVDGVSKLTRMPTETREEAQAASFRKMILAMSRDIRVIIIKLADRLHNMRTIHYMKPASQKRIACETLDIYALIAARLGMNAIRTELEDLSFSVLYPIRYRVLVAHVKRYTQRRQDVLQTIQTAISQRLSQQGLQETEVVRADRHYYGIYRKMRERKRDTESLNSIASFTQVINICRFRIVVADVSQCYQALGVVHNLYKPVTEQFRDYIAIPRINGYQSLHTTLFGPQGLHVSIQIRSLAMQEIADMGIASRDLYRLNEVQAQDHCVQITQQRAIDWLRSLLEMQQSTGNSQEFLEHVKMDLFPNEVYVFTPKGKILQLPKGATALDFAYAVHTDVGNHCMAVKVDHEYVTLDTVLESGQTVEVIIDQSHKPTPRHLNQVITARARSQIRLFLRNQERTDAKALGIRLLNNELARFHFTLEQLDEQQLAHICTAFHLDDVDQLLVDLGLGNRMVALVTQQIANALAPETQQQPASNPSNAPTASSEATPFLYPLLIRGTEGMMLQFSRCCRPIPGDGIVGFISAGRGITIHRTGCKNVKEHRHQPEKYLAVAWEEPTEGEFLVDIRVDVTNQVGVLAMVATALTRMGINIEQVFNENKDGFSSVLCLCVAVRDRQHLAAVMRHLKRLEVVTRIHRVR